MRLLPLLILLAAPLLARAEDWTTTDGKTYHDVKVLSHDDAFVTVMDADGGARIPLRTLNADLQKRLGYDAAKAAQAEAAAQAADGRQHQELIKDEQQQIADAARQQQERQLEEQRAALKAAPKVPDRSFAPASPSKPQSPPDATQQKPYSVPNAYFGTVPSSVPPPVMPPLSVIYNHLDFTSDLSTEWMVADDWDGTHLKEPHHVIIYLLVPPTVTRLGDHWEITFASSGRKKKVLSQRPNAAKFIGVELFGPADRARASYTLAVDRFGSEPMWLMIKSREFWAGQYVKPNADPLHTGSLYAFNLGPDDALGISFLEPIVTEKDGEWRLTTAAPTASQRDDVGNAYLTWMRDHPGPPPLHHPPLRYPPKLQKSYEAYQKAVRLWNPQQPSLPNQEDYLQLTPDQKKQNDAWQRAVNAWQMSGGEGAFPQPVDFIKDTPDAPGP